MTSFFLFVCLSKGHHPGLSEIPAPDGSQEVAGHTPGWPLLIGHTFATPLLHWGFNVLKFNRDSQFQCSFERWSGKWQFIIKTWFMFYDVIIDLFSLSFMFKLWQLFSSTTGSIETKRAILEISGNLPTRCSKTSLRAFLSWIAGMALSMG